MNHSYNRVWSHLAQFTVKCDFDPAKQQVHYVLTFLQSNMVKGLRLSSLNARVSALTAFTKIECATNPLIV